MTTPPTLALPGALARADVETRPDWSIQVGRAQRGDAWTDPTGHRMRLPGGDDLTSKVVRAHEMLHAKTSPAMSPADAYEALMDAASRSPWGLEGAPFEVVEAVDEVRVNRLAMMLGHDPDALADGSEKVSGTHVPKTREGWNSAVAFAAATWTPGRSGGKAHRDFLAGLATVAPDWAALLKKMGPQLRKAASQLDADGASSWGSTDPRTLDQADGSTVTVPAGWLRVTVSLAPIVAAFWQFDATTLDGDEGKAAAARLARPGYGRSPTAAFAPILVGATVLDGTAPGLPVGRKRRPGSTGRVVRYPARLLTDPQRRVFGDPGRRAGGVVLVDLSGSMDLTSEDLAALLGVSRGLTVLGYSHRPGDSGSTPNLWVLARGGRCATRLDGLGNVGNGCDGPALAFAASLRHGSDPLVWVCDGQTTDSNDKPFIGNVVQLVKSHRVHQVPTIAAAVHALRTGAASRTRLVEGRAGRAARGRG